jgi:thioredoxin 1
MLGEVLEEISRENPEVVIGKVNVDENRPLAMEFNVRSIPQLYIFKRGQMVKNISGYVSSEVILEALK